MVLNDVSCSAASSPLKLMNGKNIPDDDGNANHID